ncbi:MAG: protein kinase [Gemmatimonadaceae bacterium]|nr:protein kinase [Gemmatimonadaceae bacterium]
MPTLDRLTAALADRYRIERELGAGGMATVYLAEDLKHDRRVAIKVLKPELAAVLGAERFVVEIKTTAAMSHPHILPLFDSGEADGFLYYVMPYIEGETIREKLTRETQFGIDEAVRITREIADALDYAHRRGIIHRDIKPENILLHDGRAMVMDFGIALAVSAAAGGRMTETGLSLGTPHYMSPEQATAEKEITPRSDVYSLASVLYEMLAGEPPHSGGSAQAIIMKIIAEPAQLVTQLRKSVPTNVAAALDMALQKVPADRFASAAKFAEALANPAFTTRGTAQLTGATGSTRGVATPWFVATAAVALIATAVAGWGLLHPAPVPRVARFPLLLPEDQALFANSQATLATLTPDGRTLVYLGSEGAGRRLWVRPLDRLDATPLAGTENADAPSVSPDGTRIAFLVYNDGSSGTARRNALKVVPIGGGPVLTLIDTLVDAYGGVSWSADGYIYYHGYGSLEGNGIARVKATGGRAEIASRPDRSRGENFHYRPSALPGGRGVLLASRTRTAKGTTQEIAVLDTRTGTHRILTAGVTAVYAESGHLLFVTEGGALMAAPFDLSGLRLTGEAVLLGDSVAVGGENLQNATISLSRDGTLAYVAGVALRATRELVWVGRDGIARAVDSSWSGEMKGRPVLSPDGRSAAVVSEGQIWVKQLDRGPAMRVAAVGNAPSWSPDGKSLIFETTEALQAVPADGSVLPSGIPGRGASPQVSSDGQWVIYARSGDIFGRRTSGDTAEVPLVQDLGPQWVPSLSPDGRWLAYASQETGTPQVYVRSFPATKVAKRQVSTNWAYGPRWSRSGRELFFVQNDETGTMSLFSVDVDPGAVFRSGTPKRLFSAVAYGPHRNHHFDVSADGQRFLVTRPVGSGTGDAAKDRIVIVQNFAAELKAKVR